MQILFQRKSTEAVPTPGHKTHEKDPAWYTWQQCDGVVGIAKWHDSQCVTVATNYDSVDTVGKVKRWSVANKAAVEVPQPTVVNNYNCHMGGVDMVDSFIASYRPTFRSKKWWWPLFLNGLNMLVVAAWKLHVEVGGKFDQLAFRHYIVRSLIHSVNPSGVQAGPRPRPLDEVRKDGLHHHLSSNDKQARCRVCMKNCRMKCTKCDVPLHIHCELDYHTQWCLVWIFAELLLQHHLAIKFLVIAQFIILLMCLYICMHSI